MIQVFSEEIPTDTVLIVSIYLSVMCSPCVSKHCKVTIRINPSDTPITISNHKILKDIQFYRYSTQIVILLDLTFFNHGIKCSSSQRLQRLIMILFVHDLVLSLRFIKFFAFGLKVLIVSCRF